MAKRKKATTNRKGQVELTSEERSLIAQNIDTPFFKLLVEVILPSRVEQVGLTCVSVAQDSNELWYYKGMAYEAEWLPKYLQKQKDDVDDTDYTNDEEGEISAEDDTSVE